jgi:hypothetical protein
MAMSTAIHARPNKGYTTAIERRELRRTLAPIDANARYPIDLALVYLDCSRRQFYADVKAGRIRLLKFGRRSYAPGSELVRLSTLSG